MILKKYNHLLFIITFVGIIGCNATEHKQGADHLDSAIFILEGVQDTGKLLIKHTKSTFRGVLEITYNATYKDSGDVRGAIKGDTLIGDFSYQHYGLPKWIREPIVFLRRNNELIMGKGATVFTAGIPHFDPSVPIDFSDVKRLVFKPAN